MGILAEALRPTPTNGDFEPYPEEAVEPILPEVIPPARWDPESFSQDRRASPRNRCAG
jgi:hypothetical protein